MRRGAERYVHDLGRHLMLAGHDVTILSTAPVAARDVVGGVPVTRLRRRRFRPTRHGEIADLVAFGWQSFARLGASSIDVWHATSTADGAAAALAGRLRSRLRSVFTDHGFPAAPSRGRRTDRRYHRFVVDHVDTYVCVSAPAGDYLREDFGRDATVIPPGVDLARFRPESSPRHQRPAILYAGSLDEPRKNVSSLLAAVAELLDSGTDLEVWLLGPGAVNPLLDALPARVRSAVTVARVATPDELADFYRRAWVTVLPSRAEAFGMTVIESLACGTPAVALADSGGPAWILADHPSAGVTAASVEPVELASACRQALELTRRPGIREACRAVAEPYGWDRVTAAFERVYAGEAVSWTTQEP